MNVFKTGIIVGRFQHIHIGHEKIINIGLSLCDKLLIFIGSAQEEGTLRNPFSYEYRENIIKKIYSKEIEEGKIIIKPLDDFKNQTELSPRWGEYVFKEASKYLDELPQCIIYGKDKDIFKCFDKEAVKNITEILVDRNLLNISATKIREYIVENDRKNWEKYVDPKIYVEYENLREKLLEVYCKKK